MNRCKNILVFALLVLAHRTDLYFQNGVQDSLAAKKAP